MKVCFNRCLSLFLVFILCTQSIVGCSSVSGIKDSSSTLITENVIQEQFINMKYIDQEKITEEYIMANMIYEDELYEYKINENIISEAYIIEVIVGETTEEEILAQLPVDINEYDIDWAKVVSKFTVGTTIIIAVGVVNHVYGGSTYFVFGSPVTVAKDALIGGSMVAAINEVINCVKDGKPTQKAVKKYAIEGFADGYMWGAITSVLKVASKNFKMPKSLKFAGGKSAKIQADGSVLDETGAVGKAYYQKDGIWLQIDGSKETIVRVFDKSGRELIGQNFDDLIRIAKNRLPSNTYLKLGTDKSAQVYKTDDVGQIYRINKELMPNISYNLNGFKYDTDKYGRIIKAAANQPLKLKTDSTGRMLMPIDESIEDIGRGYALSGDERGHIIADRFYGDNSLANMVPMDGTINKGEYKRIENLWANSINEGKQVRLSIDITYKGLSYRPKSFNISYDVGDGLVTKIIHNGQ